MGVAIVSQEAAHSHPALAIGRDALTFYERRETTPNKQRPRHDAPRKARGMVFNVVAKSLESTFSPPGAGGAGPARPDVLGHQCLLTLCLQGDCLRLHASSRRIDAASRTRAMHVRPAHGTRPLQAAPVSSHLIHLIRQAREGAAALVRPNNAHLWRSFRCRPALLP